MDANIPRDANMSNVIGCQHSTGCPQDADVSFETWKIIGKPHNKNIENHRKTKANHRTTTEKQRKTRENIQEATPET